MRDRNKRFVAGHKPWNKGLTRETSALVDAVAAKKEGQKRPNVAGANHWHWKGGATTEAMRVRNSIEYKAWRSAVFERDGYACVKCGVAGRKLEADHIKPFAQFPELRLDVSNGQTLCYWCHRGKDKPHFSRRFSDEHRAKLSEAQRQRWLDPNKRPRRGPMTPEAKAKMVASKLARKVKEA